MIILPLNGKGEMKFAVSRRSIGWRAKGGSWLLFKPPWNHQLYSERYGLTKTLWSFMGFRLLRAKA